MANGKTNETHGNSCKNGYEHAVTFKCDQLYCLLRATTEEKLILFHFKIFPAL
jgi:hypothetical protein